MFLSCIVNFILSPYLTIRIPYGIMNDSIIQQNRKIIIIQIFGIIASSSSCIFARQIRIIISPPDTIRSARAAPGNRCPIQWNICRPKMYLAYSKIGIRNKVHVKPDIRTGHTVLMHFHSDSIRSVGNVTCRDDKLLVGFRSRPRCQCGISNRS